jgi:hypothetical protein
MVPMQFSSTHNKADYPFTISYTPNPQPQSSTPILNLNPLPITKTPQKHHSYIGY